MCQAPLQRQVPQAAARDMVRLDPEALGGDAFPGRMIHMESRGMAWHGMAKFGISLVISPTKRS